MRTATALVQLTAFVTLLGPVAMGATCPNIGGSPTAEQFAANRVNLKYLPTGPGGGDDRPELKKSSFTSTFVFDPLATHTVAVTIQKNSSAGPLLWTASVPASSTLWTHALLPNGNERWKFNDPLLTYGVRKAQVVRNTAINLYVVTYFLGRNQNISNAPVAAGSDVGYVMVEIYDPITSTGVCYDGTSLPCQGIGNTQVCKL